LDDSNLAEIVTFHSNLAKKRRREEEGTHTQKEKRYWGEKIEKRRHLICFVPVSFSYHPYLPS